MASNVAKKRVSREGASPWQQQKKRSIGYGRQTILRPCRSGSKGEKGKKEGGQRRAESNFGNAIIVRGEEQFIGTLWPEEEEEVRRLTTATDSSTTT